MNTDYDHVPFNFLGLSDEESSFEDARVALLGVAYDHTCSYGRGAALAPLRIIEASRYVETFDEELRVRPMEAGICTLPVMEPIVSGPKDMIAEVERVTGNILKSGKLPFLIGGEHSLTVGGVRAAQKAYPDLAVVQFDAHADLRGSYQGSKYSHACVAARIAETCPVLQLGIRSLSTEEAAANTAQPVTTITTGELMEGSGWEKAVKEFFNRPVYLTLDVDALDPSVLPATGTPEPGGLAWNRLLEILRLVFRSGEVVAMDVMEHEPVPGMTAYDFLVARLVHKMIGYRFFTDRLAG